MAAARAETAAVAAMLASDPAAELTQLKLAWKRQDQLALACGALKGENCNTHGGLYVKATCPALYDLQDIPMSKNAKGTYLMSGQIYGLSIGSGAGTDMSISKTTGDGFPAVGSKFMKILRVTRPSERDVRVTFTVSRLYAASSE